MGPAHLVVGEHLLCDHRGAFDQRPGQFGELLLLDLVGLSVRGVLHGQGGSGSDREAPLGRLDLQCQCLSAARILSRVGIEVALESFADGCFEVLIPVDASQLQVTATGHHADLVLVVLDQREVKRAAAEVVDQDPLLVGQLGEPETLGAQHVAQCCGDRFVDDVDLFETRVVAGLDRGSSLQFAELGRHGDHGPLDGSDLFVSGREQFSEDVAGDVDGRVRLVVDLPVVGGVADVAFRVLHDAVGSHDRVPQGLGADDHLVVVGEEDDRGRGEFTFLVGQGDRFAVLVEVGQAGIGGAQVDPDRVGSLCVHFESVRLCTARTPR